MLHMSSGPLLRSLAKRNDAVDTAALQPLRAWLLHHRSLTFATKT